MPRLFAFLRAINVGGRTIKMERLRREFEVFGFPGVETFIASGNVIFLGTRAGRPMFGVYSFAENQQAVAMTMRAAA